MKPRYETVRNEYARLAPQYDERWGSYIAASLRESLLRLPHLHYDRVLDVGCGTGAALHALAERLPSATLIGVDPSFEMLEIARDRVDGRAALSLARAEALPFSDGAFDLLISLSSLHYFDDAEKALREFHRVLRPGGSVLITDWCGDYFTVKMLDRSLRLLGRANFRLFGSGSCEALLQQAGFAETQIDRYRIDWFWGLMTALASK